MSVCQCNFYSKCLGNFVDVTVYIPSVHNGAAMFLSLDEIYKPERKYKTIYLLHGMLDDHSSWMRWSMVEEQAEKHNFALVMPSGQNGFYVNAVHGLAYADFIQEELPRWAEANFPLLTGREDRFIAGLSMGGYGALRNGLARPERYAAIGTFSGAVDVIGLNDVLTANGMNGMVAYDDIFGGIDCIKGTDNDLYTLIGKCRETAKELPPIYIGCGTEDAIVYPMNVKFQQAVKDAGYDVTYVEMPGEHEWKVWNECIKQFIEMIDQ